MTYPPFQQPPGTPLHAASLLLLLPGATAIHTCCAYDSKWMMLNISLLAFCSCDAHALCMTARGGC